MIEITKITDVMEHIDGLKAVMFDLDDTLYSEKEYVRSGYKAVAELLTQVDDAENKLWDAFEKNKNAIDEVLVEEGVYTEGLKLRCLDAYRTHKPDIHLYDGVEEMLVKLRKMGLKIGIITDGRPEGQWMKIRALNLEHYVDRIIVTDELGGVEFRKPCERAFVLMRDVLGCEYRESCYIGDNVKKDFTAPEKLGMRVVWFKNRDGIFQKRHSEF